MTAQNWYQVAAVNSAGMEGALVDRAVRDDAGGGAGGTTPPSKPASLKALLAGTRQIALDWPALTDDVAVTGYEVYRDGSAIGIATQTDDVRLLGGSLPARPTATT